MTRQALSEASTPSALPFFDEKLAPLAYPLVRITAGLLLIPHGAQKLFGWFGGHGLAGTGQFFATQLGLQPGLLFAGLAGFVEFFGGLALVLGLLTRPAALGVAILMAVAVFAVHLPNGFFASNGGYEFPLMWGLIALAIFMRGGGRYSLDAKLRLPF
ncbi:DoxX family protein [Telmatospirillum sp. J64-1]|uniref:DoxX family protein n=1 Tax=Telmatospirillum sp. J64-1 TaxID=2502183 RepID=UPI00115D9E3C|nr:DoxX family protein [Telmatospirillum sp. J64-1]